MRHPLLLKGIPNSARQMPDSTASERSGGCVVVLSSARQAHVVSPCLLTPVECMNMPQYTHKLRVNFRLRSECGDTSVGSFQYLGSSPTPNQTTDHFGIKSVEMLMFQRRYPVLVERGCSRMARYNRNLAKHDSRQILHHMSGPTFWTPRFPCVSRPCPANCIWNTTSQYSPHNINWKLLGALFEGVNCV